MSVTELIKEKQNGVVAFARQRRSVYSLRLNVNISGESSRLKRLRPVSIMIDIVGFLKGKGTGDISEGTGGLNLKVLRIRKCKGDIAAGRLYLDVAGDLLPGQIQGAGDGGAFEAAALNTKISMDISAGCS